MFTNTHVFARGAQLLALPLRNKVLGGGGDRPILAKQIRTNNPPPLITCTTPPVLTMKRWMRL